MKRIIASSQIILFLTVPAFAYASNSKSKHSQLKLLAPITDTSAASAGDKTINQEGLPPPSPSPPADSVNQFQDTSNVSHSLMTQSKDNKIKNLLQQGIAQFQAGNTALAEKTFRQVLQIDSHNADAHFSLGAIAEHRGDLEGAYQHYRDAWRKSPNDPEIQQALSAVESKIQDKKDGQEKQKQGEQLAAQQDEQRAELKRLSDEAASAYRNGKYDIAIKDLQQVAQATPNDPDVQYALAQAYRGKGDFAQARYYINLALSYEPSNPMFQAVQNSLEQEASTYNGPQIANGQSSWSPSNYAGSNNNGPSGQIIPMQPEVNPPSQSHYDAYSGNNGSGVARMLPMVGMMGMGYGFGHSYGGSRLTRMAEGSLLGAATGATMSAMFNHYPGSVRRGAMRGALFGGMAGLIFGGF